jgi:hypothetical protein
VVDRTGATYLPTVRGTGCGPQRSAGRDPRPGLQRQPEPPVRYPNQGRHLDKHLSPRRPARLLTQPENLPERQRLEALAAACPAMAALATAMHPFATLLRPAKTTRPGGRQGPPPHGKRTYPTCTPSPEASPQDTDAVTGAITLDHHNGYTELVGRQSRAGGPGQGRLANSLYQRPRTTPVGETIPPTDPDNAGRRTIPTGEPGSTSRRTIPPTDPDNASRRTAPANRPRQRQSTNSSRQQTQTAPVGEQSPPAHPDNAGWPTVPTGGAGHGRLVGSPHRRMRDGCGQSTAPGLSSPAP